MVRRLTDKNEFIYLEGGLMNCRTYRTHTTTLLIGLTLSSLNVALGNDLIGRASITDGDTLEIHGTRIRL
jgi:hypothetical protein